MTAKRPRRPRDPNQLAHQIIGIATGEIAQTDSPHKDPHAVELGRRGGKKGGPARADKLSSEERSASGPRQWPLALKPTFGISPISSR
jgi:hypothetical protein